MSRLHIIWDLDGTLINSEEEVLEALVRSVREIGLTEKDQKAKFRVGPTVDKILEEAFDSSVLTKGRKASIITHFRSNYDNCGFHRTPAFTGIDKILEDRRICHHIVTNKPDLATGRILEKLKWKESFASVITPYSFMKKPDDVKKTKAQLFSICMEPYKEDSFIGIGDMESDALAAKAVGIPAIGVLWGTGTQKELSVCDKTFPDVLQLQEYIEGLL